MSKLIGIAPNQAPSNADLGDLAYQNSDYVSLKQLHIGDYVTPRGANNSAKLVIGNVNTAAEGNSTTYLELQNASDGQGGLLFSDGAPGTSYGLVNYLHDTETMQFYTNSGVRAEIAEVSGGGTLQINGNDSGKRVYIKPGDSYADLWLERTSDSNNGPKIRLRGGGQSTGVSPTTIGDFSGYHMGSIWFDSAEGSSNHAAGIIGAADRDMNANDTPANLYFMTTEANAGTNAPNFNLRLMSDRRVLFNGDGPTGNSWFQWGDNGSSGQRVRNYQVIGGGANLLLNGDFQTLDYSSNTGYAPRHWTQSSFGFSGGYGSVSASTNGPMKPITAQGTNGGGWYQPVRLLPDTVYTVSAILRVLAVNSSDASIAKLTVGTGNSGSALYNVVDAQININNFDVSGSYYKWVHAKYTFDTASLNDQINHLYYVGFRSYGNTHSVGCAYMQIEQGGAASDFNPVGKDMRGTYTHISGPVTTGNPGFYANKTSGQTLTNSGTDYTVTFNGAYDGATSGSYKRLAAKEDFTVVGWDETTNRFTAPVTGVYFFAFGINFAANANYARASLSRNGALTSYYAYSNNNSYRDQQTCSGTVYLNEGDYVECVARGGANGMVVDNAGYFTVYLLG